MACTPPSVGAQATLSTQHIADSRGPPHGLEWFGTAAVLERLRSTAQRSSLLLLLHACNLSCCHSWWQPHCCPRLLVWPCSKHGLQGLLLAVAKVEHDNSFGEQCSPKWEQYSLHRIQIPLNKENQQLNVTYLLITCSHPSRTSHAPAARWTMTAATPHVHPPTHPSPACTCCQVGQPPLTCSHPPTLHTHAPAARWTMTAAVPWRPRSCMPPSRRPACPAG